MSIRLDSRAFDDANLSVCHADDEYISLKSNKPDEMWLDKEDVIAMAEHFDLKVTQK